MLRCFDFDERRLGNFDPTPMHWAKLTGPGLPQYSYGALDDAFGRDAAPSFRFHLQGGCVAYEYEADDLPVVPGLDYLVVGHARPVGLQYADAFLEVFLAGPDGQTLRGSQRISNLAGSTGAAEEDWQRLTVALPGDFPQAATLHLRLWVLQRSTWQPPIAAELDPILRQDVRATIWFDDLTVYRMPRVRLGFSEPGGIVAAGASAHLEVWADNPAGPPLETELTVHDRAGGERVRRELTLPQGTSPVAVALPELPPGLYEARLCLRDSAAAGTYRTTRFAVLPALQRGPAEGRAFGVVPDRVDARVPGLAELLEALSCGAVKLPVVLSGAGVERVTELTQLGQLAAGLSRRGYETTALLRAAAGDEAADNEVYRLLADEPQREQALGPVLTYLGAALASWQLGDERTDWAATWDDASRAALGATFGRYVADPHLILPRSVLDARWAGPADAAEAAGEPLAACLWLPPHLPARALPQQLADVAHTAAGGSPNAARIAGVFVGAPPAELSPEQRLAEYARRLVLARALAPGQVYLAAPFELSEAGGERAWEPGPDFIWLRTLLGSLSGLSAVAALPLPEQDALGLVFRGNGTQRLVIWSWREQAAAEPLELYLGDTPHWLDLSGGQGKLEVVGGRAWVPLGPVPLIIDQAECELALLQMSFALEPALLELHARSRPVLRLANPYEAELEGTLRLSPPEGWRLDPRTVEVRLGPGQTLEQPLEFELPPQEFAGAQPVRVGLAVRWPVAQTLEVALAVGVGLSDVQVEVCPGWSGADLLIEVRLRNGTGQPRSFHALCRAPQRSPVEAAFLDIGPEQVQTRVLVIPAARELAGTLLRLSLSEIGGPRVLNRLVEVPP